MTTGCLRRIENINICIKLTKNEVLGTDENLGLCLYMQDLNRGHPLCSGGGHVCLIHILRVIFKSKAAKLFVWGTEKLP